jgi:hypothetical protein
VIYDQPNSPFYGHCRRLHLKLMELFGDDLPVVEKAYKLGLGKDWTEVTASAIAMGVSEAHNARSVLKTLLYLLDTIECQRRADEVAQFKGPCRS